MATFKKGDRVRLIGGYVIYKQRPFTHEGAHGATGTVRDRPASLSPSATAVTWDQPEHGGKTGGSWVDDDRLELIDVDAPTEDEIAEAFGIITPDERVRRLQREAWEEGYNAGIAKITRVVASATLDTPNPYGD